MQQNRFPMEVQPGQNLVKAFNEAKKKSSKNHNALITFVYEGVTVHVDCHSDLEHFKTAYLLAAFMQSKVPGQTVVYAEGIQRLSDVQKHQMESSFVHELSERLFPGVGQAELA